MSELQQELTIALKPLFDRLTSIENQLSGIQQEQATYSNRVDSFMEELLIRLKDGEKNTDLGTTIAEFVQALKENTAQQETVARRMEEFVSMVNDSLYEMESSQN